MPKLKRSMFVFLLSAAPFVSAQPISISQDFLVPSRLGIASWYSESDPYINLHTANGEIFDDSQLTCASWDYAFGTHLEVTNVSNGRSIICRVNDRGPAKRLNRLIDLTLAAFRELASPRRGLIEVTVTPVKFPSHLDDN